MTSGQIKFLTLLFALVNVWLLFHIPAVGEATIKFISVGQIPGTDTALSPNVMLYLAIGAFVVSVLLIFGREFRKLFNRRKPIVASPALAPALAAVPIKRPAAKTSPVVAVVRPGLSVTPRVIATTATSLKRRTRFYMSSARTHASAWWAVSARIAKRIRKQAVAKAHLVAAKTRTFAKATWRTLIPYLQRAWAFTIRVAKASRLLAIDLWHWLEPRIRNFDRWLEHKLHSNPTTAKALKTGGTLAGRSAVSIQKLGHVARTSLNIIRNTWYNTKK